MDVFLVDPGKNRGAKRQGKIVCFDLRNMTAVIIMIRGRILALQPEKDRQLYGN